MIDPKTARRGLALVFTTLLLDIIGFGMIMPVLPAYLRELTGVSISEAAIEGGWLFFVYAAMQFVLRADHGRLERPVRTAADPARLGADLLHRQSDLRHRLVLPDAVHRARAGRHFRRQLFDDIRLHRRHLER